MRHNGMKETATIATEERNRINLFAAAILWTEEAILMAIAEARERAMPCTTAGQLRNTTVLGTGLSGKDA